MQSYYESNRDSMKLPLTWYNRSISCLPHFHAGIELVYVLEGGFTATINGYSVSVNEGELLVNNCYSVHAYTAENCYAIITVIPLSVVPSIQRRITANRFRYNLIRDDEQRSLHFFMKMLADNPENEIMQKGICYALLGYLTSRIPLEPVGSSDQADVICRILNYLNDHFTKRLTVEQVAAHFGYSRSRFSHLFKSTIGYSLPQYLNMLRCQSVSESLMTTDTPVIDLAVNAGFNNVHTFYSAFKSYYHMTPREYMRMNKSCPSELSIKERFKQDAGNEVDSFADKQ